MKIIGLVGGSGTGKSTIAAHLKRGGAGHIDADKIGHDVLAHNPEVKERLVAHFGKTILDGDRVDRRKLGALVFKDPAGLATLNAVIHPPIIDACVTRLETLHRAGHRLVVIDAALLLEVPVPFKIDLMIALRCTHVEQARRLAEMGGHTDKEIAARLASQKHLEKSFYKADVVLDTDMDRDAVFKEVDRLVTGLFENDGNRSDGS